MHSSRSILPGVKEDKNSITLRRRATDVWFVHISAGPLKGTASPGAKLQAVSYLKWVLIGDFSATSEMSQLKKYLKIYV